MIAGSKCRDVLYALAHHQACNLLVVRAVECVNATTSKPAYARQLEVSFTKRKVMLLISYCAFSAQPTAEKFHCLVMGLDNAHFSNFCS